MQRTLTAFFALVFAAAAFAQSDISKPPATFADFAVSASSEACTDFHAYACSNWEKLHPIPSDRSGFGTASAVFDWNHSVLREILESTAKGGAERNAIDQRVGDYYASCIDEAAIEKRGLAAIKPELARIDAMKSKKELPALLAHLHLITGALNPTAGNSGVLSPVFGTSSLTDFDNAKNVVAAIDQGGLGLPDRDYYI